MIMLADFHMKLSKLYSVFLEVVKKKKKKVEY